MKTLIKNEELAYTVAGGLGSQEKGGQLNVLESPC